MEKGVKLNPCDHRLFGKHYRVFFYAQPNEKQINNDEQFGYMFWNPKKRKTIKSKDVVFIESKSIDDTNKLNIVFQSFMLTY